MNSVQALLPSSSWPSNWDSDLCLAVLKAKYIFFGIISYNSEMYPEKSTCEPP